MTEYVFTVSELAEIIEKFADIVDPEETMLSPLLEVEIERHLMITEHRNLVDLTLP